jgi:hypothetical protein
MLFAPEGAAFSLTAMHGGMSRRLNWKYLERQLNLQFALTMPAETAARPRLALALALPACRLLAA